MTQANDRRPSPAPDTAESHLPELGAFTGALLPRRQLGDFVIEREIGRGGMGVVFAARQVSLNRQVALKVLANSLGLTPQAVQRFRREAETAAKLHHTNIVPIYATGEENGTYFYAMELVEGPSLDMVIRQLRPESALPPAAAASTGDAARSALGATGPYVAPQSTPSSSSATGLSSPASGAGYFDRVAAMIAEIADALAYAHEQGVIHRDIKPSNLLLAASGRLSINDFGLARMLEQPGMTISGEMLGTPRYMSPEQITAGRVPIDHRTDIYSLGATLYELLTLQPPFVAEHRDQLLAMIMHKEPRRPRRINARIPVDLETICLKAMDKDPDRRYQSAAQMAEDLRRYVNRFAIHARRAGPIARSWKWAKRNPALAAALSGVLVCAVAAAGLAYRVHRAERARADAQAKYDAELLEQKRHSALEKAFLAARLLDFETAQQAIREAEALDCSPAEIRMLQGQLELYQGHTPQAIEHLNQAVELVPDSVAAWSLLAIAYEDANRMNDYRSAMSQAMRLTAIAPEDYIFLGHAQCFEDPELGLRTVDEAVKRQPSALARLVRAEPLNFSLLDRPDLNRAKLAMEDMKWLKQQFPASAKLLSVSSQLHLTCYYVFEDLGLPELRQQALDDGLADVRALEEFPKLPYAVWSRAVFLSAIGRDDTVLDDLRRTIDATNDFDCMEQYVVTLYAHGEFAQAVKITMKSKGQFNADIFRAIAVAEAEGPARAYEVYKELAAKDPADWNLFNSQLILRLLGRKDEALTLSRDFLSHPERFPPLRQEPFRRALEFCAAQRSADSLLRSLQTSRGDLCNAHLCIALTALADGNRAEAHKHLEACIATRFYEYLPYGIAQMLLARMKKDPSWPPWIK